MIGKMVTYFCNEDISLIENYNEATNDNIQIWHCHHRKETDEGLSVKQLKEQGLYYHRPASELIFLTPREHCVLHQNNRKGWHHTKETIMKMSESHKGKCYSEETKRKHSNTIINWYKTHDSPRKGKHNSNETNERIKEVNIGKKMVNKNGVNTWAFKDEIQNYLDNGWVLGKHKNISI